MRAINTDLIGGLLVLAITGLFWLSSEEWTRWSALWPNSILVAMAALSLLLLGKSVIAPATRPIFTEGSRARLAVGVLSLVLWVLGILYVGFYVTSLIVFSFLAWYVTSAEQRLPVTKFGLWVIVIALEIGVFYLIFNRLLLVPLPRGMLF